MTGDGDELTEVQVGPLELFFDLVFVFTLTQLTPVLHHDFSWVGLAKVGLLVSVLWYMYGGFAYLTNALTPLQLTHKFFILFGMAAFLVVALSIPEAFGAGGLVFALGYLLVVIIHFGLYLTTPHAASRRGILKIAPVNLIGTGCLLAAALIGGPVHWVLWVLAPLVMWGNGLWNLANIYVTRPRHFVERHGLVLLIAFGESVVAVGVSASHHVTFDLVALAVLTLTVVASLWWAHFLNEHAMAERLAAAGDRRGRVAIFGYGHIYVPLLGSVILFAAGAADAIAQPMDHLHWGPALGIAGGVALYLVANAVQRAVVGVPFSPARLVGAVLALPTVFLGVNGTAVAQMGALAAIMVLTMTVEYRWARPGNGV
ncbi:low temperature requirement protein A [Actinocrispum sp. NPDC049592]|uniref:low temperature requirement protein A n=1 Tax=Actinocrispum sp. NPDC049592 TaxID=3154835 RepID=UPI00342F4412